MDRHVDSSAYIQGVRDCSQAERLYCSLASNTSSTESRAVLRNLNVAAVQNSHLCQEPNNRCSPDPADTLVNDLENFHIISPEKEAECLVEKNVIVQAGVVESPAQTTAANPDPFGPLDPCPKARDGGVDASDFPIALIDTAVVDPNIQQVLERHEAREFTCVLSLPCEINAEDREQAQRNATTEAAEDRQIYFGCNFLQQRIKTGGDTGDQQQQHSSSTYTLIATPLGSQVPTSGEAVAMVDTPQTPERTARAVGSVTADSLKQLGPALDISPAGRSRSRCSSVSRIEDTIEELDRMEDEFEAVHKMVRVGRVSSSDKVAGLAKKDGVARPGPARGSSVRRAPPSASVTSGSQAAVAAATGTPVLTRTGSKRQVARPASLLPPKPVAKSTKPPTMPTFELPGEAVARRLKEQREKRLSMPSAPTPPPTVRKIHSSKPPTVPTFELPGEAISRRKREEHEAKLRLQEEEEKRRREFKARPIRGQNVTPSMYPRETVTSRARTNRMSLVIDGTKMTTTTAAAANRRQSMISTSSGPSVHGRGSSVEPSATARTSRTESTSTGSVSGLRSTVSSEDMQQQKLQGKQIYQQDSGLSVDRKLEKEEREMLAKQARKEAADRSRLLSREWAAKQRQRLKKALTKE